MSGTTENATGVLSAIQSDPGVFQYTVTLTDTGNTTIGTFWFAWDDVPDRDFMTQIPTHVGAPAGWIDLVTDHLYPDGIGYGIEWIAPSLGARLSPGGSSAAFTFTSTETPEQMAAVSSFDTPFQTTSAFVYKGGALLTPGGNFVVAVACFREGTRIRTPAGDVTVESLRPGDHVITVTGESRPVRWHGRHRVLCHRHEYPEQVWPIRVAKTALDFASPTADLYLSPDHALFLDGVLVPVKHLINGTTIAPVPAGTVTWHHLELDSHDVLLAEGAPAETYLDTGDRARFDGEIAALLPRRVVPGLAQHVREARSAMELVVTGPALTAIRRRLADRAVRLTKPSPAVSVA